MTHLPKIAQQRLERGSQPGRYSSALAHPDADLLTAFVEQNLAPAERDRMMSHLATCAECREVAALSTPVADEHARLVAQPARASWTQWKFLRFGAGAAMAAAVVGVFLFTRVEKRAETAQVAGSPPAAANVSETARSKESDAFSPAVASNGAGKNEQLARKNGVVSARSQSTPSASTARKDKNAALIADESQSKVMDVDARRRKPSSALSAANKNGEALGGLIRDRQAGDRMTATSRPEPRASAPPGQAIVAGSLSGASSRGMQPNVPSANISVDSSQKQSELAVSAVPASDLAMQQKSAAETAQQYQIKSDGIAAKKSATANAVYAGSNSPEKQTIAGKPQESKASGSRWRIINGTLQKFEADANGTNQWNDVNLGTRMKLRVLVVQGHNIWAGGDAGTLFHSVNDGANWTQVKEAWTGDIIALRFNSPQQGSLETSTQETWFTRDWGATWSKQQP
jgi:hypothetical protein